MKKTLIGQDKEGLIRKVKAECTSRAKRGIHYLLPIGRHMSSHSLESRDSSHITVARENKHHNPSFPELLSKEDVRPLICGVLCEALSWIRGLGSMMCRALGSWAASVTEFLTSGVGGGGRGCMLVHPSEPLLGKTFSNREHLTLVLGHRKSLHLGERLPALLMASRVQWQRGNLSLGQFVQSSSCS